MNPVTGAVPPADSRRPEPVRLGAYASGYLARLRGGEMGGLPAIFGLLVLGAVFSIMKPTFLTRMNFANLFTQGASVTVIAMGVVFVLLLGEIDLAAGFTSGVCAAVLAVLLVKHEWPWYFAILAAVGVGVVIGLAIGLLVAKIGIPSFVVTLAAFLAFQGLALVLIRGGESITINSRAINKINYDGRVPPTLGWVLAILAIAGYAGTQLYRRYRRLSRRLAADPISVIALRVAVLAVVLCGPVYVLNLDRSRNPLTPQRGIPTVVLIIAALLIFWTFVLNRTAYGRHVYAVGGNREAARRAGINADLIRVSVFVICSAMAAIGGIIAASQANSVDPNTAGINTLLYAVGAAVIGGTSLFGGKGRVLDAVLGGALVAVINNGMGLLGYSPGTKLMVTGCVLLLAASVDAMSRRRASATGLR